MKLILSRKGFDSSSGGCPSPILPDGRLISLPIPDKQSVVQYKDLRLDDGIESGSEQSDAAVNLATLVEDLTNKRIKRTQGVHIDPDLISTSLARDDHWQAVLGQHGAAQGHLRNQGVGVGDVFLFFGLFREVERFNRRWRFVKTALPKHVLWGWMRVEGVCEVAQLNENERQSFAYHPHLQFSEPNNVLYLADHCGLFGTFAPNLQLSELASPKPSNWLLPDCFFPKNRTPLSYHQKLNRWSAAGEGFCRLQAAARGQEFVLNLREYPEVRNWLEVLIGRPVYGSTD